MSENSDQELTAETYHFHSLDRCAQCISLLDLGQKTFCTVALKRTKPVKPDGDTEENAL